MDAIEQRREERKLRELRIRQKGFALYGTFTPDERLVVRFGMLPAGPMEKATAELLAELKAADERVPYDREVARELAVAVMDAANAGPDKLVV